MLKRREYPGNYYEAQGLNNGMLRYFRRDKLEFVKRWHDLVPPIKTTESMQTGIMIHMYLLQPDEFAKKYRICENEIKTPQSPNMHGFCDDIIKGSSIIDAYKNNYRCGSIEKITQAAASKLYDEMKGHIEQLKTPEYTYISPSDIKMLNEIYVNFKDHKGIQKLMEKPHLTEFEIRGMIDGVPTKALLDYVSKDASTIMDIKTSSKSFFDFTKMLMEKPYDILTQLMFYRWQLETNHAVNSTKQEYFIVYINPDLRLVHLIRLLRNSIEMPTRWKEMINDIREMAAIVNGEMGDRGARYDKYEEDALIKMKKPYQLACFTDITNYNYE